MTQPTINEEALRTALEFIEKERPAGAYSEPRVAELAIRRYEAAKQGVEVGGPEK